MSINRIEKLIITETSLKGSFLIELEKIEDERGFFSRAFDESIFQQYGLKYHFTQCNISFSKKKGTIKGMHYQLPPHAEAKFIRCTKGKIFDVIIDIRPSSKTYKKWKGFELSAENYKQLYIPEGFAHGLQTLEDNTEIFYQNTLSYYPDYERGIRWDDPIFNISWPLNPTSISKKDMSWKPYLENTD